jgi:hypothetical protein
MWPCVAEKAKTFFTPEKRKMLDRRTRATSIPDEERRSMRPPPGEGS